MARSSAFIGVSGGRATASRAVSGGSADTTDVAAASPAPTSTRPTRTQNRPPLVKRHQPAAIDMYLISEHQLMMLEAGKRDSLVEFGWAMLALATGAAPSAIPALIKAYGGKVPAPLAPTDLVQIMMLVLGLGLAALAFAIVRSRGKALKRLGDQIRAQKG